MIVRLILAALMHGLFMGFRGHPKNLLLVCILALACALGSHARAAGQAALKGTQGAGYERILAIWPEADAGPELSVDAQIKNNVLIVRFSKPLDADPKALLAPLKGVVALARMDANHLTLRAALRGTRKVHVSHSFNVFAIDLVPPGRSANPPKVVSPHELELRQQAKARAEKQAEQRRAAAQERQPGPALPLKVRSAQTNDYTRIAFDWTRKVGHSLKQEGNTAIVDFDRPAVPDLSRLNADSPHGLIEASSQVRGGQTRVRLDLAPGMRARMWEDGSRVMVDIYEPSAAKAESTDAAALAPKKEEKAPAEREAEDPAAAALAAHMDPTPADGMVHARVSRAGTGMQVIFDFAAPVGSAAFRRADTIWIVFDDDAILDLQELEHGASRDIQGFDTFHTKTASGVRLKVYSSTQIEAMPGKSGAQWTFSFGDKVTHPPKKLVLHREADGSGPGRLVADLPNVTNILFLKDPDIGDRLSVATALGPATGVLSRQHFVEVNALPSAQGLAFEINADDVQFKTGKDQVVVLSSDGLSLTPSEHPLGLARNNHALSSAALSARSATPGFIDFRNWAKGDPKLDFNDNYDALMQKVALEATDPKPRIELARFLVANHMAPEALGMLSLAHALDPMLVQDAGFRALRGTAKLLMHRIKEARADFAAQTLNRDPSAALWRGYLAEQMQDWGTARREFDAGREAFYLFTPHWQARLRTAYARAALELNDMGTAKQQLDEAFAVDADQDTRLRTRLLQAAYVTRLGDTKRAIRLYQDVADAHYEPLESKALFNKIRLQIKDGELKPAKAADMLENLRYRWRGDNTELEEVLTLGKLYSGMHDYRRALESMNTAVLRFPDSPVTRRISDDMHRIFNNLFLHGGADDMDPVKALALFYQFIDMVPIGADGDRMLRLLADRLIAFDLLPQATELLQHQVDKRLGNAVARAQVGAKLALVYLMDHKPEKALNVIRSTGRSRLPRALNHERRLIEARAFMALGSMDQALEIIETDRSREASLLRADIIWRGKNWPKAGPAMLKIVERYIPVSDSLSEDEASLVLRTAIALSLAQDRAGVELLKSRYGTAMAASQEKEVFEMATSDQDLRDLPIDKLAPALAQTQNLRAVLKRYEQRYEDAAEKAKASAKTGASAAGQP